MSDYRALLAPAVFAGLEVFAAARRDMAAIPAAANGLLQDALTALVLGFIEPDESPDWEIDPEL